MRYLPRCDPALRAARALRATRSRRAASTCAARHRRLEAPVGAPVLGESPRSTSQKPDRQARQVRRAERRRLGHRRAARPARRAGRPGTASAGRWPPRRRPRAARPARCPQSPCIGVEQVGHLERDALERRARDVRRGRAARDPDDGARARTDPSAARPGRRTPAPGRRRRCRAPTRPAPRRRTTDWMMPSPSRSHCTTAPPMKTLPSSAYIGPCRRLARRRS